jgi:cytochrome c553
MKNFAVAALCGLIGLSGAVYGAGDAAAGKAKSAMCAGCHGPDGNATVPMYPKLAGQHEQYLVSALKAYKDGTRNNPIMKPMAGPLSDQDIENLAAYFSSQPCK